MPAFSADVRRRPRATLLILLLVVNNISFPGGGRPLLRFLGCAAALSPVPRGSRGAIATNGRRCVATTTATKARETDCSEREEGGGGGTAPTSPREDKTVDAEEAGGGTAGEEGAAASAPPASAENQHAAATTIVSNKSSIGNNDDERREIMRSDDGSNVARWLMRGVVTELFHNIFVRSLGRIFSVGKMAKKGGGAQSQSHGRRLPARRELAIVTGATGGIGSRMCIDLAFRGYDVVVAARDRARGEKLVEEIRGLMRVTPVDDGDDGRTESDLPTISFVEYHADVPKSALSVASSVRELRSPLSVLINNAGIMGKSKRLTMKVNLLGPAMLTLAVLPLMERAAKDGVGSGGGGGSVPTVINVGSSAHLRATRVMDNDGTMPPTGSGDGGPTKSTSWMDSLPDVPDDDLTTYARSKLALMQFSTLLRSRILRKDNDDVDVPTVQIFDAHPGLVWTPLLRNHIGDAAVRMLTRTGLAGLIYKSPEEGAEAIVSALDYNDGTSSSGDVEGREYFVNGRPGGYAATESASAEDADRLWELALAPELEGVVELPMGVVGGPGRR